MKRRIRLTENDLHRIIKESVNRVLNEDYEFGYNEYGEPSYYIRDYPTYDDRIQDAALSINDGDLDDIIWDEDWYKDMKRKDEPILTQAIEDRRCYLDKDYAINHGYKRSDNFYNNTDRMSMNRKLEQIPDKEKKYDKEFDKLRKGRDFLRKKYGKNIPKEEMDKLSDAIENKYYLNTKRNPNKEKLHTKDSLNRVLINRRK